MRKNFSIKKFLNSFGYALTGLRSVLQSEQNFRVHLVAAISAIGLGLFCGVSRLELAVIVGCIAAVMAMEAMNTAVEKLCDVVSPQYHEKIKMIKDLAAAAVLLVSAGSLIVGCIILLPYLIKLF